MEQTNKQNRKKKLAIGGPWEFTILSNFVPSALKDRHRKIQSHGITGVSRSGWGPIVCLSVQYGTYRKDYPLKGLVDNYSAKRHYFIHPVYFIRPALKIRAEDPIAMVYLWFLLEASASLIELFLYQPNV